MAQRNEQTHTVSIIAVGAECETLLGDCHICSGAIMSDDRHYKIGDGILICTDCIEKVEMLLNAFDIEIAYE